MKNNSTLEKDKMMGKVKGLWFSCMDKGRPNEHPQETMYKLGITYELSVPQSMGDGWQFYLPKNVPDKLPSFLSWFECDPMDRVGHGLSKDDAKMLIKNSPDVKEVTK